MLKEAILQCGFVSHEMRRNHLEGLTLMQVRDWLKANDIDPQIPIEAFSTEVAICTPRGVIMQIKPADNNALCMWGGEINHGEEPIEGAIRELYEETGLTVSKSQLHFMQFKKHTHIYANGNIVRYSTYRYVLKLDHVPPMQLDPESSGCLFINDTSTAEEVDKILEVQRNFILNLVKMYCE